MGFTQFLKERKLDICLLLILAGGALLFVTIMAFLTEEGGTTIWNDVALALKGWTYWLMLFAGAIFVLGLYYTIDFVRKHREFNRLVNLPGKSKFIQNQDRIEELAWRLGRKYEKTTVDKKKELRIR